MVAALAALEALGAAADEHLHLLLPALTRLISNSQISQMRDLPVDPRKQAIRCAATCSAALPVASCARRSVFDVKRSAREQMQPLQGGVGRTGL